MDNKKTPQKQNTHRSAYDEFIHSDAFDAQYDYESFYPSERSTHAADGRRRSSAAPKEQHRHSQGGRQIKKAKTATTVHRTPRPKKAAFSTQATQRNLSQEYLEMKAQKEHQKKQKQDKNDGLYTLIAAFLITAIIFAFSLFTLTGKVKPYSENENRYLAGRPHLSAASVSDGKYMKDMESYLSDQFAGRSVLIKTRTAIDILMGKKESNGVYIGKNHFLFEKPTAYDEKTVGKTIEAINTFTDKHKKINSYMAIAPDASDILSDLMPKNAPNENQKEQIKTVYNKMSKSLKTVDIYTTLENSNEKQSLYYRTDHHWTTKAAEIAFKQIAANMKIDTSKVNHKTYAVTNDFQGTLASSSGLFNAKDNIYITVPVTDITYFVTYVQENKKSSSVFDTKKLNQKNKYEVFFGGNFAKVKIDTTLNSKRVLMIVKDSYANCLVPMLTPYYKTIIMIDPRYYTDKIEKTVKDEGVTDVLWLYNANTFLADTSIDITF